MKSFLLAIAIAASAFSAKATPADYNVSAAVEASFNASFKGATEVVWKSTGDYQKADFVLNGQYVAAYYDADAKLVAVTRNISSVQLPLLLQNSIRKSYANSWVSELFELSDDNGTSYYITLESAEAIVTLKSDGVKWSVYRKASKS